MYISYVALSLTKYASIASLDEINVTFIPEIWISSMYKEWFAYLVTLCNDWQNNFAYKW